MNCCNANGQCNQGKDCPVRKQRIKEVNDAYANGYKDAYLDDPYEDLAATLKGLIAGLVVIVGVAMVVMAWWHK